MLSSKSNLLGEFQEKQHGKSFSYAPTKDSWALAHGFAHEVDVGDGVRFANVLKTRAKVAVDEAPDGNSVIETWLFRTHNVFH